MKRLKIVYWASTVLFAGLFGTTGTLYLLHFPAFVKRSLDLGYPLYVVDIIGTAKVLGAIALLVPRFSRLKEWAYAGFAFDFIGALWSHLNVQGPGEYFLIAIPFSILMLSYFSYHRLQRQRALFTVVKMPGKHER